MAKIPKFTSEQEESEFWDTHEITDYLDDTEPVEMQFVDARPRKTLISLRMEPETIVRLKQIAHSRGLGYQTLIRMWIMEHLVQEQAAAKSSEAPPLTGEHVTPTNQVTPVS